MSEKLPLEVEYLKPFIESTIASSSRFRRVLLVLIVVSIIAFTAFWNSRAGSWQNSRLNLAHKTEKYLSLKERVNQLNEQINIKNSGLVENEKILSSENLDAKEREKRKQEKDILTKEKDSISNEIKTLQEDLGKNYADSEKWTGIRGFTNPKDIEPITAQLERNRVENVFLIRLPFFGVIVDINDLGLLGGFAFVIVLMWFRFSLWREYYNLKETFEVAESEHLKYCYTTLAMNQVLTVPPTLSKNQPQEKPWGKVVRLLYFLPIIIQLAIFAHDCYTFEIGRMTSELNTITGISISLCFLGLSSLLTYWCYRLSGEIDKLWLETFNKLPKESTEDS